MDLGLDDIRALIATIDNNELKTSILDGFNNLATMQEQAASDNSAAQSRLSELQDINRALLSSVTVSQLKPAPENTLNLDALQQSFIYRPENDSNSGNEA